MSETTKPEEPGALEHVKDVLSGVAESVEIIAVEGIAIAGAVLKHEITGERLPPDTVP